MYVDRRVRTDGQTDRRTDRQTDKLNKIMTTLNWIQLRNKLHASRPRNVAERHKWENRNTGRLIGIYLAMNGNTGR